MLHLRPLSLALLATTLLGAAATAQTLPPTYVTDVATDTIYLLEDLNGDGDWNDAGEVLNWYDENVASLQLDLPLGIELGPAGALYACDDERIYIIDDLTGDGDANDPNELNTWFFGFPMSNASMVPMFGTQDMHWDLTNEVLYVAATGSSFWDDSIVRLEDLNMDGDADDVGEAVTYFVPAPGGSLTASLVLDVTMGTDGALYYVEGGLTGLLAKGVYRLEDLDSSGTIDQANEVTPYYTAPAIQSGAPSSLKFGLDGFWYLTDRAQGQVIRFRDADASGSIQPDVEDSIWYTSPVTSSLWEIAPASDGSWILLDGTAPTQIRRLVDGNSDGMIDPVTEAPVIYDGGLATVTFSSPRGIAVVREPIVPFRDVCSGSDSGIPGCGICPCGNNAAPGVIGGCINSAATSSRLLPSGTAAVSADTLHFDMTGAPAFAFCILNSGDNVAPTGMANPCFGLETGVQSSTFDGLRCAVGNTRRHGGRPADANGEVGLTNNGWGPPNGPMIGLAAQGGFAAGQTRFFQVIHRDDPLAVCTRGLNSSQAVGVVFFP